MLLELHQLLLWLFLLILAVPALGLGLIEYVVHAESSITRESLVALRSTGDDRNAKLEVLAAAREERSEFHGELAEIFDKYEDKHESWEVIVLMQRLAIAFCERMFWWSSS